MLYPLTLYSLSLDLKSIDFAVNVASQVRFIGHINSIFSPFTLLLNHSYISTLSWQAFAPLNTLDSTTLSVPMYSSVIARFFAIHDRIPAPKAKKLLFIRSFAAASSTNHLSGLKTPESGKETEFICISNAEIPTSVPGGKNVPLKAHPGDGTRWGRRDGFAIERRRPSLTTAVK